MPTINQNIAGAADENFKAIEEHTKQERARIIRLYHESYQNILSKLAALTAKIELKNAQLSAGQPKLQKESFHEFSRLETLLKQIENEIKRLQGAAQTHVKDTAAGAYEKSYYSVGHSTETQLGVSLGFGLIDRNQIDAAVFREPYQIRWEKSMSLNHAIYYRDIKSAITTGLMQGKGYGEIAKDVQNRAEISAGKTIRIINTETHRAAEAGTLAGYAQVNEAAAEFGLETKKKWVATFDQYTRPTHAALDGQYEDAQGLFWIGTASAQGPSQFGLPEEDINCRCTTVLEIAGLQTEKRLDNTDKKLVKNQSFKEWKAGKEKAAQAAKSAAAKSTEASLQKKQIKQQQAAAAKAAAETQTAQITQQAGLKGSAASADLIESEDLLYQINTEAARAEIKFEENYKEYHGKFTQPYDSGQANVKMTTQLDTNKKELGENYEDPLKYGITTKDWVTMNSYTRQAYGDINKNLIHNTVDKATQAYTENFIAALDKLPNFKGEVVRQTKKEFFSYVKEGDVIESKAFTSAGLPNSAFISDADLGGTRHRNATLHIKSKTGKYIAPISSFPKELEIVFKPNTKFKIEKVVWKSVKIDGRNSKNLILYLTEE